MVSDGIKSLTHRRTLLNSKQFSLPVNSNQLAFIYFLLYPSTIIHVIIGLPVNADGVYIRAVACACFQWGREERQMRMSP